MKDEIYWERGKMMNWFSVLLVIYLGIGIKEAYGYVKFLNESVDNREKGIENDNIVEEGLGYVEDTYRMLGFQDYRKFTTFIFTFITVAWLPIKIIEKGMNKED